MRAKVYDERKEKKWIRQQIRLAIEGFKKDDGMPKFYNSETLTGRELANKDEVDARVSENKPAFYYCKSDRKISDIADKIFERFVGAGE